MRLELLEFEEPQGGHCCSFCNPFSVADYETQCIPIRRAGGNRAYVCLSCVKLLGRAARTRTVQTNVEDLAQWQALERQAERQRGRAP